MDTANTHRYYYSSPYWGTWTTDHNHHNHCKHTLKFCHACNVVYCDTCGKEWIERFTWTLNTAGVSSNLTATSSHPTPTKGTTCCGANHAG